MWSEVADGQCGILTRAQARAQARASGLTEAAIRARVDSGRWRRLHPGFTIMVSEGGSVTSVDWTVVVAHRLRQAVAW